MIFLLSEKQENPIKDIYIILSIYVHATMVNVTAFSLSSPSPHLLLLLLLLLPPPQHDTEKKTEGQVTFQHQIF